MCKDPCVLIWRLFGKFPGVVLIGVHQQQWQIRKMCCVCIFLIHKEYIVMCGKSDAIGDNLLSNPISFRKTNITCFLPLWVLGFIDNVRPRLHRWYESQTNSSWNKLDWWEEPLSGGGRWGTEGCEVLRDVRFSGMWGTEGYAHVHHVLEWKLPWKQGWQTTQWINWLPFKHGNWSLDLQNPYRCLVGVVAFVILKFWSQGRIGILKLTSHIGQLPISKWSFLTLI